MKTLETARLSQDKIEQLTPVINTYLKKNKNATAKEIAEKIKKDDKLDLFPSLSSTQKLVQFKLDSRVYGLEKEPEEIVDKKSAWKETNNTAQWNYEGPIQINTLDEALLHCDVDLAIWDVDKFEVSNWTTPIKQQVGKETEVELVQNSRVKVTFKKRGDGKSIVDLRKELITELKQYSPSIPNINRKIKLREKNLLNVNIYDMHLDKLAYAEISGEDSSVEKASKLFMRAIEGLLNRSEGYDIDRILFPVGNDFFNSDIDMPSPRTTRGTPQALDLPWQLGFKEGRRLIIRAIEYLKQLAPVDVVVIPGNHDTCKAFYLGDVLEVKYENDRNVGVNNHPMMRKYYHYENNLIGLTHGEKEKVANLAQTMAQEVKELWAKTFFRYWKLGHLHHERKFTHLNTKDYMGVVIEHLPSLSAVDEWHNNMGYIGSIKGAKADVHNSKEGRIGRFEYNLTT